MDSPTTACLALKCISHSHPSCFRCNRSSHVNKLGVVEKWYLSEGPYWRVLPQYLTTLSGKDASEHRYICNFCRALKEKGINDIFQTHLDDWFDLVRFKLEGNTPEEETQFIQFVQENQENLDSPPKDSERHALIPLRTEERGAWMNKVTIRYIAPYQKEDTVDVETISMFLFGKRRHQMEMSIADKGEMGAFLSDPSMYIDIKLRDIKDEWSRLTDADGHDHPQGLLFEMDDLLAQKDGFLLGAYLECEDGGDKCVGMLKMTWGSEGNKHGGEEWMRRQRALMLMREAGMTPSYTGSAVDRTDEDAWNPGLTENLNGLSIDWVHVSPGVARLHPASRFLLINEMLAFCVDTRPARATSIHCRTTESDEDLVHALEENEFDLANTISDSEFQERMGLANALRWKTQKHSESAKLVIPKSNVYTYLVPYQAE